MIGSLLKDLVRAFYQFFVFHLKRPFAAVLPREQPGSGVGPGDQDSFPSASVARDHDISVLPAAPPRTVTSIFQPKGPFDWQTLGSDDQPYGGGLPIEVLNLLLYEPRFLLDVGCSKGDFTAQVKQRFPRSKVWGIEPNKRAADIASNRIDRVLAQTIEETDWNKEGVERGDIDTVLLFDVLEHINDPWTTLLKLRNLVSGTAQLLVSIPNVRNALLLEDLVAGHWRYRRAGLLDITHLRFFTLNDMYRMFYQTGFRVVAAISTQCNGSRQLFEEYKVGKFPKMVVFDSASITVHNLADLQSLCALQHIFTIQPAEYEQLSDSERRWIDSPHPATAAFGV